jgi:hypothetical protein
VFSIIFALNETKQEIIPVTIIMLIPNESYLSINIKKNKLSKKLSKIDENKIVLLLSTSINIAYI